MAGKKKKKGSPSKSKWTQTRLPFEEEAAAPGAEDERAIVAAASTTAANSTANINAPSVKTPAPTTIDRRPLHFALATFSFAPTGPSGFGLVVWSDGQPRREFHLHLCHAGAVEAEEIARDFLRRLNVPQHDYDRHEIVLRPLALAPFGPERDRARVLAEKAACFAEFDLGSKMRAALIAARAAIAAERGEDASTASASPPSPPPSPPTFKPSPYS